MEKEKKNNYAVIIVCTLTFVIIARIFLINLNKNSIPNLTEESSMNIKEESKLEKILKSSSYFKNSKFEFDEKNNTLKIDEKYVITSKVGSYLMDIRDIKNENTYCQIVDAIETSFGYPEGNSIETCKKTLEGSIALGGISAEIYDTYKILTVDSEAPATLYDSERSRSERELISKDEINYNIEIDNYLFTSMSTKYTESKKDFSVCGHVYNKKNKERDFIMKIYDENKNQIGEKIFTYTNDKKNYLTFCVNYKLLTDTVAYFSIEGKND